MNTEQLFLENGEPTGVYFCSKCRTVYRSESQAEDCCLCLTCRKALRVSYYTVCDACKQVMELEQERKHEDAIRKIFDAAEEVTEFEHLWWNDRMYSGIDEILDDCEDGVVPEFVHPMKPEHFEGFVLQRLIDDYNENILIDDDAFDVSEHLSGLDELNAAFDEFNQKNENVVICWFEDNKKKVRVKPKE